MFNFEAFWFNYFEDSHQIQDWCESNNWLFEFEMNICAPLGWKLYSILHWSNPIELLYLYCCINYMNRWGRLSHDIDFCRIFNSMSRIRLQIDQNLIKRGHIIENSDWRKEYGGRMGRIESRECGFDCLLGKDSKLFNLWQDLKEKWPIWVYLSFVLYHMLISFS